MLDAPELRDVTQAAEQAAAAGDHGTAERLLRQAAELQEARLGPSHPDLANTFNNLGVVCEKAGKPDDAERWYRRAYAVAASALAPDDPLVLTSGQNLREFCKARGRPIEPTAPPPPIAARAEPHRSRAPSASDVSVSTTARPSSRFGRTGVEIVGGLVLLALVIWRPWSSTGPPEPEASLPTAQPSAAAAQAPDAPVRDRPGPVETPTARAAAATATPPPGPAKSERPDSRAAVQGPVSAAEAQVCRSLSTADWDCVPASSPTRPGQLFFYTRVRSASDTTVQHRWYFEGQLLRTISLRVGANPYSGYRTYSRNTITAGRAGNWRVELRNAAGAILHEQRFVVR